MTTNNRKLSKLRWHCRRGVKELDVVLCQYLENYYESSSDDEKITFQNLLSLEDPILLSLLMAETSSKDPQQSTLLEKLRNMSQKVQ